jgi:two-component system invasion response regulator UvrY
MIKVLIADDHAIVRKGLKQILEETPDLMVAGEADNGREILSMIRKEEFDVIVLDISLPGKSGLDILKDIKNEHPNLPVLVLSMHPEEQYAIRVLKAGAKAYLTKESAPDELITALRKVSRGGKYITSSLAERLAGNLEQNMSQPLHNMLSDREYTVMCLIASGKTISEIAEELCLSPKTISTYRTRLLKKMHMKTNAEVMHYAMEHSLVD